MKKPNSKQIKTAWEVLQHLSHVQIEILLAVRCGVTLTDDIAELINRSYSAVNKNMRRLEEKGYIAKAEKVGRFSNYKLTN